ncbi:type-2 ice-structuring protein-like [Notolabrus celidotus]|uniref:type-2 ice-structuring protein-like n=1 Tax=Notolabrus celidotus TaxID=1203425 RepID=UPI00148FFABE|nr:type-2 ice-structuring protein-like [Notolabrus celidotus]
MQTHRSGCHREEEVSRCQRIWDMKLLTVSALLCAVMALTGAAVIPEEETGPDQEEETFLDKRSTSCAAPWSKFNGRCFRYFPKRLTWSRAERNCHSIGGNLASVHNIEEYHEIQRLVLTATYEHKPVWIGGSDAHQEGEWLWSDGSQVSYTNWCPGEPNNHGHQHCLQMNWGDEKCWDDLSCAKRLPFVCAKRT